MKLERLWLLKHMLLMAVNAKLMINLNQLNNCLKHVLLLFLLRVNILQILLMLKPNVKSNMMLFVPSLNSLILPLPLINAVAIELNVHYNVSVLRQLHYSHSLTIPYHLCMMIFPQIMIFPQMIKLLRPHTLYLQLLGLQTKLVNDSKLLSKQSKPTGKDHSLLLEPNHKRVVTQLLKPQIMLHLLRHDSIRLVEISSIVKILYFWRVAKWIKHVAP
mmetsp:Transcript_7963/g.12111  ORF Transcript_7963/g.12111 Transcript_7963/m.12111 type:complete len:217 (+) Transcript_7963:381-1031(+)